MVQESPKRKKSLSHFLKLGVIVSCCAGVLQHDLTAAQGFMDSIFMAFTVQSNIWAAAICLVLLGYDLLVRGEQKRPKFLYLLKYMFTTSILLTWLAFALLLTPTMPKNYLFSLSNLFLHYLTPLLAFLDFVYFDPRNILKKRHLWLVLIMPFLYLIFFFAVYYQTGRLPVPYFFLDVSAYGWFSLGSGGIGVAYWIVGLSLMLLGIGAISRRVGQPTYQRPWLVSLAAIFVMLGVPAVLTAGSLLLR